MQGMCIVYRCHADEHNGRGGSAQGRIPSCRVDCNASDERAIKA